MEFAAKCCFWKTFKNNYEGFPRKTSLYFGYVQSITIPQAAVYPKSFLPCSNKFVRRSTGMDIQKQLDAQYFW
jgi:hypothetical protein